MAKRIYLRMLEAADLVRELEMLADAAITDPLYAVQFWQDVRIDGLRGAMLSLISENLYRPEPFPRLLERADDVLRQLGGQTVFKSETDIRGRADYSNPALNTLPLNSEPEGNGFDHINVATPIEND